MGTPLVSVCVPVYNGEVFLEACLAGITEQTFTDFEVLIVDDCSRDGGMAIARRWAAADPRFRVHVNEKNAGLVGNWNRCIELSRGKWIKFLFQDDLIEPDCLAEMLRHADGSGGFIACARRLVYEGEPTPALVDWYAGHQDLLTRIHGPGRRLSADGYTDAKLSALDMNIIGEPSVTLIDRELFDRFGLFDPLLVQMCDSEMWNRLAGNVGVDYIGRELVAFRVHPGSASGANRSRHFRSGVLEEIIELNRLCYAPQLAALRRRARATGAWRDLRKRLNSRVNGAIDTANAAARAVPPDPSLNEQLKTVMSQLPGYAAARLIHFLYRARLPLRRAGGAGVR